MRRDARAFPWDIQQAAEILERRWATLSYTCNESRNRYTSER